MRRQRFFFAIESNLLLIFSLISMVVFNFVFCVKYTFRHGAQGKKIKDALTFETLFLIPTFDIFCVGP